MPDLQITYGGETRRVECPPGQLLGEAVLASGFPLEQPCAGRGTCGKCKVLAEGQLSPPDEIERRFLLEAEQRANMRLACRARVAGAARVTLTPVVVYSSKIFSHSDSYRTGSEPLGLAIDLGSTTVAALLVSLVTGQVYAGAAALNQQTIFGADVIARLAAAETEALTLSALAQASIYQALGALKLSRRVLSRIRRAVIVGNTAMQHLLLRYPVDTLGVVPFRPHRTDAVPDAGGFFSSLFPPGASVGLAPLIGGFVGSDTTACLAYFDFDRARAPRLVIDLGTNGEVMATDGRSILVTSTAAGPAFEGANISCGRRAVDGAIVGARLEGRHLKLTTIGGRAPIGVTGSGLLSLVHTLRQAGALDPTGRLEESHPWLPIETGPEDVLQVRLAPDVALTQLDIRELQKAKGAIRVAADLLLEKLGVAPDDLEQLILTGAFGGQVDLEAAIGVGLIPDIRHERIRMIPNGAGLGAALFLQEAGFQRAIDLAAQARHVELDQEPEFNERFVDCLWLG